MKNKNLVIALIVALLLIVFGVGAFFLSQNKTKAPSTSQTAVTPTQSLTKSAENTLKDLLASKSPTKCTYSTDAGTTKISGIVYVSNGKVRGDFTTTAGKTVITGHMATDAKYVYTWTDGSKQGYKFAMDAMTGAKTDATTQKPDFNQKFNYSCSPWVLDSKMLELPTDVTFTAFSMPVAPSGTTGTGVSNQTMCAACSGLTGEAKTTCLTQLKCN